MSGGAAKSGTNQRGKPVTHFFRAPLLRLQGREPASSHSVGFT